jgi:Uma2 family endonuclease
MTVNAPVPPTQPWSGTMDVDEFMDFLETRPDGEHWELIEAVAVMMAPTSFAHKRIAYNFCSLLNNAFAAGGLDSSPIDH